MFPRKDQTDNQVRAIQNLQKVTWGGGAGAGGLAYCYCSDHIIVKQKVEIQ